MTRNGKIARLPQDIREALNERILNGQTAEQLLDWLHAEERVWEMLEAHGFDAITDGNISEWKAGGYRCWRENQEAREMVVEIALKSRDLGHETLEENMGQCVGNLLMVEFIKMAKVLVRPEEDLEKRWKQLERVNRELARLRWSNTREVWAGIQQKRSDWAEEDRETAEEEKHAEWVKQQRLAQYRAPLSVAVVAGDKEPREAAWRMAAREVEIAQDLPRGFLDREHKGGFWYWDEEEEEWRWMKKEEKAKHPTSNIQQPTSNGKEEGRGKNEEGKARKGKKTKHPTSKRQHPEKHQTSSSKGKVRAAQATGKEDDGSKMEDNGEKSATPHVVSYQEKENGSSVATRHQEKAEGHIEGTNLGRDAQNDPRDAGATPQPKNEKGVIVGVIPTNSDQLMGGGPQENPNPKIQTPEKLQTSNSTDEGGVKKEVDGAGNIQSRRDGTQKLQPVKEEMRKNVNPPPGLWKMGPHQPNASEGSV